MIGGANVKRQIEKLKEKPEVLIGTPGRVIELMKARKLKSHLLRAVVLDEADQMLQKGSTELVTEIVKQLQKKHNWLSFQQQRMQLSLKLRR